MASCGPDLVGCSPAMARLGAYLPKLARADVHVLITGETGTGKERLAEAIHRESARRNRPLIAINCAAIPDSLVESELFGFERGAFTGAHLAYSGKLRVAEGGTVFLDEIGEMSRYAQAKLLRVIENHELFPLGGTRIVPIDVRFIAATNCDLGALVAKHRFRADLFYRLNVGRIDLPPLRDRPEDIPLFFMHFLNEYNRRFGTELPGPAPELLKCLIAYEWPGNVRELRNLVEAIFIDPPHGPIGCEHLPEAFRHLFRGHQRSVPGERDRLLEALNRTQWNKAKAAVALNWSRMTLYRKLQKYHLERGSL